MSKAVRPARAPAGMRQRTACGSSLIAVLGRLAKVLFIMQAAVLLDWTMSKPAMQRYTRQAFDALFPRDGAAALLAIMQEQCLKTFATLLPPPSRQDSSPSMFHKIIGQGGLFGHGKNDGGSIGQAKREQSINDANHYQQQQQHHHQCHHFNSREHYCAAQEANRSTLPFFGKDKEERGKESHLSSSSLAHCRRRNRRHLLHNPALSEGGSVATRSWLVLSTSSRQQNSGGSSHWFSPIDLLASLVEIAHPFVSFRSNCIILPDSSSQCCHQRSSCSTSKGCWHASLPFGAIFAGAFESVADHLTLLLGPIEMAALNSGGGDNGGGRVGQIIFGHGGNDEDDGGDYQQHRFDSSAILSLSRENADASEGMTSVPFKFATKKTLAISSNARDILSATSARPQSSSSSASHRRSEPQSGGFFSSLLFGSSTAANHQSLPHQTGHHHVKVAANDSWEKEGTPASGFARFVAFSKLAIARLKSTWNLTEPARNFILQRGKTVYDAVPRADLILTAAGTAFVILLYRRRFRRFNTVRDLPMNYFKEERVLKGLAVHVNDSDNVRFFHKPFWSFWNPSFNRNDLKNYTLNIRLAGIDAPEMGHFGNPDQPYAVQAKEWLTRFVEGKSIKIKLHRVDQYGRAVATVHVGWIFKKNVSLEMIRAGFAVVYTNSGAEYGGIEKELKKAEARAKQAKTGMWKQSIASFVSPALYKQQIKAATAGMAMASKPS